MREKWLERLVQGKEASWRRTGANKTKWKREDGKGESMKHL